MGEGWNINQHIHKLFGHSASPSKPKLSGKIFTLLLIQCQSRQPKQKPTLTSNVFDTVRDIVRSLLPKSKKVPRAGQNLHCSDMRFKRQSGLNFTLV